LTDLTRAQKQIEGGSQEFKKKKFLFNVRGENERKGVEKRGGSSDSLLPEWLEPSG